MLRWGGRLSVMAGNLASGKAWLLPSKFGTNKAVKARF
jgi:hypothetical protein